MTLPFPARRKQRAQRPVLERVGAVVLLVFVMESFFLFLLHKNSENASDTLIHLKQRRANISTSLSMVRPILADLGRIRTKEDIIIPKARNHQASAPIMDKTRSNSVVLVGLVRSTEEILDTTWELLATLSCLDQVAIHITVASHTEESSYLKIYDAYRKNIVVDRTTKTCAPLHVELQDELLPKQEVLSENRILRLARVRDAQRARIQNLFFPSSSFENHSDSVVMVIDLDLVKFPDHSKMMVAVETLRSPSSSSASRQKHSKFSPEVICGAGITMARAPEMHFYDTFATVFWSDTFSHPLHRRLIPSYYHGEDPNRVRSENPSYGNFTQGHMMEYLYKLAEKNGGLAPVRSCFGGLAMYRASTWLTPQCRYDITSIQDEAVLQKLLRYANNKEKQPCEHVVFHDCLHRQVFQNNAGHKNVGQPRIAIDPELLMLWRKGDGR